MELHNQNGAMKMTNKLTTGAAVLLEALRHGWNIAIATPSDVRRIDDQGAVTTVLRPGKATDLDFAPVGSWTGRDGIILLDAGLVQPHGRGGVFVPTDLVAQKPAIEVVEEDAFGPMLKHCDVEAFWAYRDGDHIEMSFDWTRVGGGPFVRRHTGTAAHVVMSMRSGQYRTLRRVMDGELIDHVEIEGTTFTRAADGSVRIVRIEQEVGIDITLRGDDLVKVRMVLEDMAECDYEARIGLKVAGALQA